MTRRIVQRAYFRKEFERGMRMDVKVATTRSSKLGEPGDLFFVHGMLFEILSVKPEFLNIVADRYYQLEGFASRKGFVQAWRAIHKDKFDPHSTWQFHLFRRLPPGTTLIVNEDGVELLP